MASSRVLQRFLPPTRHLPMARLLTPPSLQFFSLLYVHKISLQAYLFPGLCKDPGRHCSRCPRTRVGILRQDPFPLVFSTCMSPRSSSLLSSLGQLNVFELFPRSTYVSQLHFRLTFVNLHNLENVHSMAGFPLKKTSNRKRRDGDPFQEVRPGIDSLYHQKSVDRKSAKAFLENPLCRGFP